MTNVLLITANCGSVFEQIEIGGAGVGVWMAEVKNKVLDQNPDFIAVHIQESGGKNYVNGSPVIGKFFSFLVESFVAIGFHLIEGFSDSISNIESEWTALSSIYFIRDKFPNCVHIWNFKDDKFEGVDCRTSGKIHIGEDLNSSHRMKKQKFPLNLFPHERWSRKGFMRTRWRILGTIFDLVNIHLFHDTTNLISAQEFPSLYAVQRAKGIHFMLESFSNDDLSKNVPIFIFGDFNFRLNTHDMVELFRKESKKYELTFDAKKFHVSNYEERFKSHWEWLKKYEHEAESLSSFLFEFDISFHPTYPFDEGSSSKFLQTRCPSWCDRVLLTHDANSIISNETPIEYNLIGSEAAMGDHKPVYLRVKIVESKNGEKYEDDESKSKKCFLLSFLRGNLGSKSPPKSNSPLKNLGKQNFLLSSQDHLNIETKNKKENVCSNENDVASLRNDEKLCAGTCTIL